MVNPISSFIGHLQDNAEYLHENIDPSYKKEKEEIKESLQKIGLISNAALIASVALGILGIACVASGGLAAIVGVPLILVSLPIGYLAFNSYKISENFNEIVDNPKKYQNSLGLAGSLDKNKVKNKLKQGTFGFGWIIDAAIENLSKKKKLK